MRQLTKREFASLTLLSIVVPASLFVTFRLTGVLQEPITISETIALEAVEWDLERLCSLVKIGYVVKSSYGDSCISVDYSIVVGDYAERYLGGSDVFMMVINFTANLQEGFVYSANVTLWEYYPESEVWFVEAQEWPSNEADVENLSIIDYFHLRRVGGLKACMEFAGLNRPKSVHFDGLTHWFLQSAQDQNHLLEIAIELLYYNGTAYKKVVQPFQLKIGPDGNNSFETASAIGLGVNSWLFLSGYDEEDYYKIHVEQGHVININATCPFTQKPDLYLDLYSPEREWKAGSPTSAISHDITFTADSTGEWFIKTRPYLNYGFYSITINVYPP